MATKPKAKKPAAAKGKISYTTSNVFNAPLKKVWEAATQSKHLKKHFIDAAKGEFGPKLTPVTWTWKNYGSITIQPTKFEKEKELVWEAPDWEDKNTLITIRFEFLRKDGKTIFRVHESGYKASQLKKAFMMCEGWTEFHCGVKAYVKWGKDMRKA